MRDDVQLLDRPQARSTHHRPGGRPPFDCIALLLQGGGALGAYQGGVYEGLAEAGLHPDWTAGISIGAINAALIAGNPPEKRVEKVRQFWELVTSPYPGQFTGYHVSVDAAHFPGYVTVTLHDLDHAACRDAYRLADRIEGRVVIAMQRPETSCQPGTSLIWRIMP